MQEIGDTIRVSGEKVKVVDSRDAIAALVEEIGKLLDEDYFSQSNVLLEL